MTYIDGTGRIVDEEQVITVSGGWCAPSATIFNIMGGDARDYWTLGPGSVTIFWPPPQRQQETLL